MKYFKVQIGFKADFAFDYYEIRQCEGGYEARSKFVKKGKLVSEEKSFDSWAESVENLLPSGRHEEISENEFYSSGCP